jgi:hypothetical protein
MNQHPFDFLSDTDIPEWADIEAAFHELDHALSKGEGVIEALKNVPMISSHLVSLGRESIGPVYRARQLGAGEDDKLVATFSFPKNNVRMGRANRVDFPVFYGSLLVDTAIQETYDELRSDEIWVGEWKSDRQMNVKQFLHPRNSLKSDYLGELQDVLIQKYQSIIDSYSSSKQQVLVRLANRLGEYFLSQDFTVSSLLAHDALYDFNPGSGFQIDAIAYPSRAKSHAAMNLAITPAFASNNLHLEEVRRYRVKGLSLEGADVQLLSIGRVSDGRIHWFEPVFDILRFIKSTANFRPESGLRYEAKEFELNGEVHQLDEFIERFRAAHMKDIVEAAVKELNPTIMNDSSKFGLPQNAATGVLIRNTELKYEGRTPEELMLTFELECRYRLQPIES